jgi:hypothetical protein
MHPCHPGRAVGGRSPNGDWEIKIDHDHNICPQDDHSCERCRRGLACNPCNTHKLSLKPLYEDDDHLHTWLEFIGLEGRDRLRNALELRQAA